MDAEQIKRLNNAAELTRRDLQAADEACRRALKRFDDRQYWLSKDLSAMLKDRKDKPVESAYTQFLSSVATARADLDKVRTALAALETAAKASNSSTAARS